MRDKLLLIILISIIFYACKKVDALLGPNANVNQISVVIGLTGDDTLSVTGTSFSVSSQLSGTLNGTPLDILSSTSTQIVATLPAGAYTAGNLIIKQGALMDTFPYSLSIGGSTYSPLGSSGSILTINGTGFAGGLNGLTLTVNGTAYTILNSTPTQIVASSGTVLTYSPNLLKDGVVKVSVGTQTIITHILFIVASVSPSSGTVGTTVTISGLGFNANAALDTVKFNGTPATEVMVRNDTIIAKAPQGGTTGPVSVTIGSNTCIGPVFNYPQQVSSFAGSGVGGAADGLGTAATFKNPENGAFDKNGNLYVADYGNNEIRKIDNTGNVTTFAGKTNSGYQNGTLSSALFNQPAGLVFDAQGNLYVSDQGNNVIRKIDPQGNVSSFAGNGSASAAIADGIGTSARFNSPIGIAVDTVGGNLYVADAGNNAIRQINLSTANVTTIAGYVNYGDQNGPGTTASFSSPRGICVYNSGNAVYIYVADYSNNMIREVILLNGSSVVSTLFGTQSPGSSPYPATFHQPNSVCLGLGSQGLPALYIADASNHVIRVVQNFSETGVGSQEAPVLAGMVGIPGLVNGSYTAAEFYFPDGVAYNPVDGNLYVIEFYNNDVRKILIQ